MTGVVIKGNCDVRDGDEETPHVPTTYKELFVVITEGKPGLETLAAKLKPRLDEVTNVTRGGRGSTLVVANTALDALEISGAYGYIPLVLIIGDKREGGQANLALPVIHSTYEGVADVHNAFHVKTATGFEMLSEINDGNIDNVIDTILQERERVVGEKERITQTGLDELFHLISRQQRYIFETYPSVRESAGKRLRIIKVGGSMHDLIMANEADAAIYKALVDAIANIAGEGASEKANAPNIIITLGGGAFAEPARQARQFLDTSEERFRDSMRTAIREHAKTLEGLFSQSKVEARVLDRSDLLRATEDLIRNGVSLSYVPIVLSIPSTYQGAEYTALPYQSDRLGIALAHHFRVPNVIYIKDVSGIRTWDPKLTPKQIGDLPDNIRLGPNRVHRRIYAHELPNEISRIGPDGRSGHLVEDDALQLLSESPRVGSIQIVNGRNTEEVRKAIMTEEQRQAGSYILK